MQDLLGEVHDLDVLGSTAVSCRVFPDVASRNRWHERILSERTKRIERYRAKMVGDHSLWRGVGAPLPPGKQSSTPSPPPPPLSAARPPPPRPPYPPPPTPPLPPSHRHSPPP